MADVLEIARKVWKEIQEKKAAADEERLAAAPGWPPACQECVEKFGRPYARLFPLMGHRVWTPQGTGVLEQVFHDRARVTLDVQRDAHNQRMTDVDWSEVLPIQ